MTQKEFEEITGLKTDAAEYAEIEKMFMAADNMSQKEFCLRWRQTGKNPLTMRLARKVGILMGQLKERDSELNDVREKVMDHARFLLGKAQAYEDSDFRREAVHLIGEGAVVRLKLISGYPLWDEDRKLLLEMLEDKKG